METQLTPKQNPIKLFFERESVKQKFSEMLGKRAPQFITSVLQIATSNKLLENADPISIYNSAAIAATLDLPLNNNLGYAWIVPYAGKAQFQMGAKGFVQLAQRTGQYLRINVVEVYSNQFKSWNSLTEELEADFSVDGVGAIVGFCSYFKLINGFEKTVYWSAEKVRAHGKKYSKSFGSGPWKDEFDKMAKKTVLKYTLSAWGILSIEMQTAMKVDQGIVNNDDATDISYIDSTDAPVNKEEERVSLMISDCKETHELDNLYESVSQELKGILSEDFNNKRIELPTAKNSKK